MPKQTALDIESGPEKIWVDRRRRLAWMRNSIGKRSNWIDASYLAGRFGNGWRLPTRTELATLIDDTKHRPAHIDDMNLGSHEYWTSTPFKGRTSKDRSWFISFGTGVIGHKRNDEKCAICLVRYLF